MIFINYKCKIPLSQQQFHLLLPLLHFAFQHSFQNLSSGMLEMNCAASAATGLSTPSTAEGSLGLKSHLMLLGRVGSIHHMNDFC